MEIKTVAVVGAGVMGGGIAHQAAICGFDVILCDVEKKFVEGALERARGVMDRKISKGKMTAEEKDAILGRMSTTTDMNELAPADFVIEAIIENLEIKQDVFKKLDGICRKDTVFATNTSSMSVTSIASVTERPERVGGMHFFNPPQVMKLVEIVRGYSTSDETIGKIRNLAEAMGKTTILARKDTPGFIVNRLLFAQFLEAVRMFEEGVATKEDIDVGLKLGLNHPMGPFELMDYGSLDLMIPITEYFYNETKDDKWVPPHSLKSVVRAGRYGRKNGAGWYDYN